MPIYLNFFSSVLFANTVPTIARIRQGRGIAKNIMPIFVVRIKIAELFLTSAMRIAERINVAHAAAKRIAVMLKSRFDIVRLSFDIFTSVSL